MNLNQQIAEFFVQKGLIDPESKNKILAESEAKSISFYTSLLKNQVVDETKVFEALSEFYSLEFYNTSVYNLNEEIISKIPMSFIKDNRMIPFAIENNSLVVLIDEPYRVVDVDALSYFFDKPSDADGSQGSSYKAGSRSRLLCISKQPATNVLWYLLLLCFDLLLPMQSEQLLQSAVSSVFFLPLCYSPSYCFSLKKMHSSLTF